MRAEVRARVRARTRARTQPPPPPPTLQVLLFGALSANIVTEEPIDMVLHESYAGRDTLW